MRKFIINLGVICGLLFTQSCGSNVSKEETNSFVTSTEDTSIAEIKTVIKHVYINEEDFDQYDPYNGELSETKTSYWYVYYQVNQEYEGYTVIELETPYF